MSAANIYQLLQNSSIMDSHRNDMQHAVQDAYSMRCAPQVAGAARDTLEFARTIAARELAGVADNPVVLPDGRVESTGNFHGAPLGFAADFLAIELLAGVSRLQLRARVTPSPSGRTLLDAIEAEIGPLA